MAQGKQKLLLSILGDRLTEYVDLIAKQILAIDFVVSVCGRQLFRAGH
jgi:hypothetical protein